MLTQIFVFSSCMRSQGAAALEEELSVRGMAMARTHQGQKGCSEEKHGGLRQL